MPLLFSGNSSWHDIEMRGVRLPVINPSDIEPGEYTSDRANAIIDMVLEQYNIRLREPIFITNVIYQVSNPICVEVDIRANLSQNYDQIVIDQGAGMYWSVWTESQSLDDVDNGEPAYGDVGGKPFDQLMAEWDQLINEVRETE
jgi:hypothetical protein